MTDLAGLEEEKTSSNDPLPQSTSTDVMVAISSDAPPETATGGGRDTGAPMEDVCHPLVTDAEQPQSVTGFTAEQLVQEPPSEIPNATDATDGNEGTSDRAPVEGEEPPPKRAKMTPEDTTTTPAVDSTTSDVERETTTQHQQKSKLPPRRSTNMHGKITADDVEDTPSLHVVSSLQRSRPLPGESDTAALDAGGADGDGEVEGKNKEKTYDRCGEQGINNTVSPAATIAC